MKATPALLTPLLLLACGNADPDVLGTSAEALRVPTCADVTHVSAYFDGTTVRAAVGLASETCRNLDYAVRVLDSSGALLAEQVQTGDTLAHVGPDATQLGFTLATGAQPSACLFVATERNGRVLDRAPDSNCVVLVPNAVGELQLD